MKKPTLKLKAIIKGWPVECAETLLKIVFVLLKRIKLLEE